MLSSADEAAALKQDEAAVLKQVLFGRDVIVVQVRAGRPLEPPVPWICKAATSLAQDVEPDSVCDQLSVAEDLTGRGRVALVYSSAPLVRARRCHESRHLRHRLEVDKQAVNRG